VGLLVVLEGRGNVQRRGGSLVGQGENWMGLGQPRIAIILAKEQEKGDQAGRCNVAERRHGLPGQQGPIWRLPGG